MPGAGQRIDVMDEDRIRLMTRLAMYEQDPDTGNDLEIVKYHKRDYIAAGIVGNIFLITIAYVIILAVYLIRNISDYMEKMTVVSVKSSLLYVFLVYGIILALYTILVFVVRSIRYEKAQAGATEYYEALEALSDSYDAEDGIVRKKSRKKKAAEQTNASSGRGAGR